MKKERSTRSRDEDRTHIALLRGINVGGKNKLLLKDLVAHFTDAGCTNVRTYIQSGNIVFQTESAQDVSIRVSQAIWDHHQYRVPIVMRSAEAFRKAILNNPFVEHEERRLHLCFLSETPSIEHVKTLDPNYSAPDQFVVRAQEIYLDCPNGLARTKLTNQYFDRKLSVISTMRNWRTVLKLSEMLGE